MNQKDNHSQLLKLVWPISFQYLMTSLVSASDAFMLGFLDQTSLSAVSLAAQVAFVFSLFYYAFVFGFNVLGAQYWGKKDEASVKKVITITLKYTLIVGILFSLVTLTIPETVMRIFTSDTALITTGARYLRVVSASYFLTGISQIYFGVLKVCDRAGLSSLIGSLAVVVNIGLNALFIFGIGPIPEMGVVGAALATVCARVFEVIFALIVVQKYKCPSTSIRALFGKGDALLVKDYWKYSLPLLANQLGWGLGVTMYSVIMGHLGTDAATGYLMGMLLMSTYYVVGGSLNSTIIAGIFPAGGDTKFGMYCDTITLWCVVVPLGLIFAFWIEAPVLVVAFILTLDEIVKIPAVYWHYMKYKWVKNITREM